MNDKQTIERLEARIRQLESRQLECQKPEEELRASRQRYITLIDTLPHGIQECTVDGEITFSNSAHHRILGYADGELIGQKIWDLLADEEAKTTFPGMLVELAAE
jgi:PAS domain-containing protein